jgi:hypothetical protein
VFFRSRHARTGRCAALCVIDPLLLGPMCPTMRAPGSPGFDTEVSHATQERTPRRRLLSRSPVNDGRVSLPSHGSSADRASLAATKSSERSSVATIHARASPGGDFKNCCMLSGEFDGSDRDHFFQGVTGRTPATHCLSGPRDQYWFRGPRCSSRGRDPRSRRRLALGKPGPECSRSPFVSVRLTRVAGRARPHRLAKVVLFSITVARNS